MNVKRTVAAVIITVILILSVPVTLISFGLALPPQYSATYYAELPEMVNRLKNTEGKRIVVVGGSAVAFGLRGDLMESEFEGYTVCPFGLYGAIGTKAMMEFSKKHLREGDIVILAPEQLKQSQSTYFGSKYIWRAIEGDLSLITSVSYSDMGGMVGAFAEYTADRFKYWSGNSAPVPDGVYARSSFDENCMMVYDRPHNVMSGGCDVTAPISYAKDVLSQDFANYVNEYNAYVSSKGAKLYFGFTPVNALAVDAEGGFEIDEYYEMLTEKLDCDILGNPNDFVFECEWFYDNNVHCNNAGAVLYTRNLVKALKAELEITSPTQITVPDKPPLPEDETDGSGDDAFADCFTYGEQNGRPIITGLTEKGLTLKSVTVPYEYNGKKITAFTAETFAGNENIEEIKLQTNIRSISDGSFNGCNNLTRLYVADNDNPSTCIVQGGLLNGAPKCRIYVKSAYLSKYATDYFWARFSSLMTAY